MIHWTQAADRDRFDKVDISDRFYIPNPMATRALSMGHHTMIADLLWIRTVLIFRILLFIEIRAGSGWLE